MTLAQIRNAQDITALTPAIRYLCDHMQAMPYGDFIAYKRTLETQAVKVGGSISEINRLAIEYQEAIKG